MGWEFEGCFPVETVVLAWTVRLPEFPVGEERTKGKEPGEWGTYIF